MFTHKWGAGQSIRINLPNIALSSLQGDYRTKPICRLRPHRAELVYRVRSRAAQGAIGEAQLDRAPLGLPGLLRGIEPDVEGPEVEANGTELARLAPGSVLGERASVEQGRRTATVRAVTDCRVVSYLAADLPARDLRELAAGHYREGR